MRESTRSFGGELLSKMICLAVGLAFALAPSFSRAADSIVLEETFENGSEGDFIIEKTTMRAPLNVIEGPSPNGEEPNGHVLQIQCDAEGSGLSFYRSFRPVEGSDPEPVVEFEAKVSIARFTDDSDYLIGLISSIDDLKNMPIQVRIREWGGDAFFYANHGLPRGDRKFDKVTFSKMPIREGDWYWIQTEANLATQRWGVTITNLSDPSIKPVSARDLEFCSDTDSVTGFVWRRRTSSRFQLDHRLDDLIVRTRAE